MTRIPPPDSAQAQNTPQPLAGSNSLADLAARIKHRRSDLQRFLHAVRTLAWVSRTYSDKAVLDALGEPHVTAKQKEDVAFASKLLDPIAQALLRQRLEHARRCHQCGRDIDSALIGTVLTLTGRRADAQYCGPACRQKAHRTRVTAKAAKRNRKRNVVTANTAKHKPKRNGNLVIAGLPRRRSASTNDGGRRMRDP